MSKDTTKQCIICLQEQQIEEKGKEDDYQEQIGEKIVHKNDLHYTFSCACIYHIHTSCYEKYIQTNGGVRCLICSEYTAIPIENIRPTLLNERRIKLTLYILCFIILLIIMIYAFVVRVLVN
jgi:hypothetical protein